MRSRTVTTLVCPARAAISLGETLGLPTKLVDTRSSIQPQRPYGCTADAMAGTLRFRESDGRWIGEVYVGRDPRGQREFLTRSRLVRAPSTPIGRPAGARDTSCSRLSWRGYGAVAYVRGGSWSSGSLERLPSSSAGVRSGSESDRSHGRGPRPRSCIGHGVPFETAIGPTSAQQDPWRESHRGILLLSGRRSQTRVRFSFNLTRDLYAGLHDRDAWGDHPDPSPLTPRSSTQPGGHSCSSARTSTSPRPLPGPEHRARLDQPEPLALAVLALQAQEALEVLAAREVALARDQDELTWEQVGEAFGISTQSAHHRFARKA